MLRNSDNNRENNANLSSVRCWKEGYIYLKATEDRKNCTEDYYKYADGGWVDSRETAR